MGIELGSIVNVRGLAAGLVRLVLKVQKRKTMKTISTSLF